jgi:hypothetical protein
VGETPLSVYLLWIIAAYLVASACVRTYVAHVREQRQIAQEESLQLPRVSMRMQLLASMQPLGITCLMMALWAGAPMFFEPKAAEAAQGVAFAGLLSGIFLPRPRVRMHMFLRAKHGMAKAAATLILGTAAGLFVVYLRSAPRGVPGVWLEMPLAGEWRVVTGGRTSLTNYHHGQPAEQNYAIDLELAHNPARTDGEQVVSPCDCTVVRADSSDPDSPEGNLVILRTADGIDIWLAHLKDGSIQVQQGQTSKVGDPVAQVGATGNAESAHLHIHAQRGGEAVAMRFGKSGDFPVRGDRISGGSPTRK